MAQTNEQTSKQEDISDRSSSEEEREKSEDGVLDDDQSPTTARADATGGVRRKLDS